MTGGGVYPAIAVLQALENKVDEILWIGSQSGMEETLLKSYDLSYQSIPAAGLHGVGVKALPGNLSQLYQGWRQASALIARFQPQATFMTGGYLGVPVAMASRKIPSVVFVPDIEPGLALKTILRSADKVAASCEDSLAFLPKHKTVVTGYPIRTEMSHWQRPDSRAHFKLPENEKVLLVFGGSKGARSINQALRNALTQLLPDMHILHISGKDNFEEAQSAAQDLPDGLAERYHLYPFLHEDMGAAFAAADLVVCRAGASTLGELPFFGLPAILVPYPYAWRYQHQNAEYLSQGGGAILLEDKQLEAALVEQVRAILNNPQKLTAMRAAMQRLSVTDSANRIGELILSAGASTSGGAA
ncbi:MAG: UDP-N-acetylglucosamine--N-acetylmuramyl-(pentapeptide) pyrophosphoryl-undecaprenol [Chloroflexota bacterium]|nr:UDP-N-acetylglucosamine--N-acetylmuramyl-(pentapeptide) pyrophosphoryl-undecaprenol [Chloroflexota bacterium]